MTNKAIMNSFLAAALLITAVGHASAKRHTGDEGMEGREVGTPIKVVGKDGKVVWDICIGPIPCGPGQIKIAKSAEQEACEADPKLCSLTRPLASKLILANLNPNPGEEDLAPRIAQSGNRIRLEQVCDSSENPNCGNGQQMGGNDEEKPKGQQMGPDMDRFKKLHDKIGKLKSFSW